MYICTYLTDFFPSTDFSQTKDQSDDGSHCCAIFSSLNEVINIRHLLLEAQRRCFFFVCFFILLICTGVLSTWHANFKWKTDASVERPGKCLSEKIKEVTIFQVSGFNIKTYHLLYICHKCHLFGEAIYCTRRYCILVDELCNIFFKAP